MSQAKLIVVDDELDLAEFVCDVAEQSGFIAEQYNDALDFKKQYDKCADVIILDLMMPGVDGVEIIRFLAQIECDAHLILVSGFDSGVLHSAQKLAVEQGLNFSGSLNKPFRPDVLSKLLKELSIVPKNEKEKDVIEPPTIAAFRHALKYNELVIHYQPKIDFNDASYLAVEALVRWQHPEQGMLPPDLFIPLAEKHGLIDELTWYVLEKSLTDCNAWRAQGKSVTVSINMSASTLKELYLPEKMEIMMRKHKLEASQIMFEVTESSLMQELIKSLDILTRLRLKGFQLSIDDFGTGYSSLLQLHRVPFSEIKIDKSFIFEMDKDEEASSIIETIILLAKKLKMKTVAEGVETQMNFDNLKEMGCDQAQGFLLSKAIPADEILEWFDQYNNN